MELITLTRTDAENQTLPINPILPDAELKWYAVEDNDALTGYMAVEYQEEEVLLRYIYTPELYRGMGYSKFLLEQFAEQMVKDEKKAVAYYERTDFYGEIIENLLSRYGFESYYNSLQEYTVPFSDAVERFAEGKTPSFNGKIYKLKDIELEELLRFWDTEDANDNSVGFDGMNEADPDKSVVALDEQGKICGALLIDPQGKNKLDINALWTEQSDNNLLRALFYCAVINVKDREDAPESITFTCVNEKVAVFAEKAFEKAVKNTRWMAEAEFDPQRYLFQKQLRTAINGGVVA